jgi:hypothetical protein
MSLKEDVNKLLVKFGLTESDVIETKDEAKEEVKKEFDREKFEDVSLLDGTVIMVEPALEVGAAVVAMDEEIPVPLPVGEYELNDGRILVVVEAGVIDAINEASTEEEVIEEELNEEVKTESTDKEREARRVIESIVTEKVFALEEKFKKQIEDLTTALSEEKKERVEFSKESLELISKIGNEPKEEPKQKKKSAFGTKQTNIFIKEI